MSSRHNPEPTGWDSLPGDPWEQPYGLPFFRGEKVSVCCGRLGPSNWYEHTLGVVRFAFTFNDGWGLIEATRGDRWRMPAAFLGPHQFCIIPPQLETTLVWRDRAELVVLYDESDSFWEGEDSLSDPIVGDYLPLVRRDPHFARLIEMFFALCRQGDQPEPEFVEGIGIALASRTLAHARSHGVSSREARSGLPLDTVDEIAKYIDENPHDAIPTTDLARKAGLSPDHFARRFKITTKMSPKQFVLRRRMEKVRELLSTGNYNVTQAGQEVGFHDPSHLNRCFRNVFGCSPMTVLKAALVAPGDN